MELSSLSAFLVSAKSNVETAVNKNLGDTHVILGNEAADLDSVVSSIVTAYYTALSLSKEEKENKAHDQMSFVFPVINCRREDLVLRTEVTYFLKENGLRLDILICRDEIDLMALHLGGKLKLTLVDHNVLSQSDARLATSIYRVIDHHKREKGLDRRDNIESVGSCATLVAEMVLGLFNNDPLICRLLYGTIVLDTVNLSPEAKRATAKDVKLIMELEECLTRTMGNKAPNRGDIFDALVKARSDISQFTVEQLLRKDCKLLKTPEITIGIPAVPLLAQKFMELPNAVDGLKNFLRANRCTAVVLMGYQINETTGEMLRDNVVFSDGIHKAKQVCTPLESNEQLQFKLIRHASESQAVYFVYEQQNIALSRKYILPFLGIHFESKAQSQLDVDALSGVVDIVMPHGEMSPNKLMSGNVLSPVPSISYTNVVQNLGVGDPISQGGSAQNSAYNSCPYTPQNSCSEAAEGLTQEHYFLPSFNSRDMIEKIELKRGKLRGYEKTEDELKPGGSSSYPFTPKNSYVESSLDSVFEQQAQMKNSERQSGGILHSIDSDLLLRKLMEKRRGDSLPTNSYYSSSNSSKSQSLTKLNMDETLGMTGEFMNAQLAGIGNPSGSPNQTQQFGTRTPPTNQPGYSSSGD